MGTSNVESPGQASLGPGALARVALGYGVCLVQFMQLHLGMPIGAVVRVGSDRKEYWW